MNITKTLVVVIKTDCVFCEVGTEFLHNIYTTFRLGSLSVTFHGPVVHTEFESKCLDTLRVSQSLS